MAMRLLWAIFEGDRRGKGCTVLTVEPARNGHEQDEDAEAGRLEEVTVSMLDLRKAMSEWK